MWKPVVAVGSMLGGFLALSVLAYAHSDLGTRKAPVDPVPPVIQSTAPSSTASPSKAAEIVLEPVVITAMARTSNRPEAPKPVLKQAKKQLVPCSKWREVNALYIQEGGAVGKRQVRDLCWQDAEQDQLARAN